MIKRLVVFQVLLLIHMSVADQGITTEALFKKFNLRTIYSSYGQRLKYYCESYPIDFFLEKNMSIDGAGKNITLTSGSNVWIIEILDVDKIGVTNQIVDATYNTYSEYQIHYNVETGDWRADEANIGRSDECVEYQKY